MDRLPNVVGIGAPRCGTTWLHNLLSSHPKIAMPQGRKELSFFTLYYDRGSNWYSKFFPSSKSVDAEVICEISPSYMYSWVAAAQIAATLPNLQTLLLVLRQPAQQYRSYYNWLARYHDLSSDQLLARCQNEVVHYSFYFRHIRLYLEYFPRDAFHVVLFDDILSDPRSVMEASARRLRLDPRGFSPAAVVSSANEGGRPRNAAVFRALSRAQRELRRLDQDWLVNLAIHAGAKRYLLTNEKINSPELDAVLAAAAPALNEDIESLGAWLGRDLSSWILR